MEGLGNENVKFLCIKTSNYEKMHLYEVEKKTKNSTLNKFLEQRNEKLSTETMRWLFAKKDETNFVDETWNQLNRRV